MIFNFKRLNKKEITIFLVLILLFLIFYFIRIASGIYKLYDSEDYLYTANLIADGTYFQKIISQDDAIPLTKRPFLYPLFLYLVSFFNLKTILFIQTLFGIFNTYLMIQLLKKINASVSYLLVIFTVFTPSIFIYTQLIMADWVVMTLIMLLSFLLFDDWTKKRFFYIQIITTLLAFTKPIFYILIYFNFVYFAFVLIRKKTFSFSLFIPMICLYLYLGFNNYRTGYTHFSSIENINLIEFNLYFYKSKTQSTEMADQWKDSVIVESNKFKDFKSKSVFFQNIGKQEISKHFLSYSFYHFYTSIRGIFDPGRFDLMTFFKSEIGKEGFMRALNSKQPLASIFQPKYILIYIFLVTIFIFQIVKLVGTTLYVFKERNKIDYLNTYLVLTVILYILLNGPVNSARYMMPFQGLFIVFAVKYLQNRYKTKI